MDTEVRQYLKRTDSQQRLPLILDQIAAFEGAAETGLGHALGQVSGEAGKRGIVVIFSDCFDDEEGLLKALEKLSYQGHEVILFHILDPYELTFPFEGTWKFRDLESAEECRTTPADFRDEYLANIRAFCDRLRSACHRFQAHYVLTNTETDLAETLNGYLAFRHSVRRR